MYRNAPVLFRRLLAMGLLLSALQAAAAPLTEEVAELGDWIGQSGDSQQLPYLIVDKKSARLFAFDAAGRPLGSTPVLLGSARGDDSVPGIGERRIADILPHERTTPAGRFVAEPGANLKGEDILWVDYDAAVSMHRVRSNDPRERRLQRLASATPDDNRISWGCINVPERFYNRVLRPTFAAGAVVVYVLPETRSWRQYFGG
jgi:hypothetical protein